MDRNRAIEIIQLDEEAYYANKSRGGRLAPFLKAIASYYKVGNAYLISIGIEMCMTGKNCPAPFIANKTLSYKLKLEAKDPLVKHDLMAANYEFKDNIMFSHF